MKHVDDVDLNIGDIVLVRFTDCNRSHQFKGVIVGKTKNYWKVEVLQDFREAWGDPTRLAEEVGRVMHIATQVSRTYSANNCISRRIEEASND
jgi:hypothetical protein